MKLYLIRHAIAAEALSQGSEADRQRPLTERGRRKMRATARSLRSFGVEFDLILCSPLLRTRQTAEILAGVFKIKNKIMLSDHLVPSSSADKLISEINHQYLVGSLAIVGHEPALSSLINRLIGNQVPININLRKGGVCMLSVDDLPHASPATLEWLVSPSILIHRSD